MSHGVEKALYGFSVPTEQKNQLLIPLETRHPKMPQIEVWDVVETNGLNGIALGDTQVRTVEGLKNKTILVPNNIPLFDKPERHIYEDSNPSNSLYIAETSIGRHWYLLSFLGPGLFTSDAHFHLPRNPIDLPDSWDKIQEIQLGEYPDGIEEYYEIVWGSAKIHHGKGVTSDAPKFFKVASGIDHQMEGGREGAVVSILMTHAATYPPEYRHIH